MTKPPTTLYFFWHLPQLHKIYHGCVSLFTSGTESKAAEAKFCKKFCISVNYANEHGVSIAYHRRQHKCHRLELRALRGRVQHRRREILRGNLPRCSSHYCLPSSSSCLGLLLSFCWILLSPSSSYSYSWLLRIFCSLRSSSAPQSSFCQKFCLLPTTILFFHHFYLLAASQQRRELLLWLLLKRVEDQLVTRKQLNWQKTIMTWARRWLGTGWAAVQWAVAVRSVLEKNQKSHISQTKSFDLTDMNCIVVCIAVQLPLQRTEQF